MGFNWEVLWSAVKKPYTEDYPKKRPKIAERFRGRIIYHPKTCIGCQLCFKNCPVNAITFHKKGRIDYDMGKCIYCGLCRDVCPTKPKSIEYSHEFEYADSDKKKVCKNRIG